MTKLIDINELNSIKKDLLSLNEELLDSMNNINYVMEDIEKVLNTPKSKKNIKYLKDYYDQGESKIKEYNDKLISSVSTSIDLYRNYLDNVKKNVGDEK